VIDNELLRHQSRDFGARVLFDECQCQVDARGHACRGPHRAVDDKDAVFLQLHSRVFTAQTRGEKPVGGGAPAVEQAGLREIERPCAGRADAPRGLRRALQKADQGSSRFDHRIVADHQHGIETAVVEGLSLDRKAGRSSHRTAVLGEQYDLIDRFASRDVGKFEDRRDGQVDDLKAFVQHYSDT
jgi:hypothetical protein